MEEKRVLLIESVLKELKLSEFSSKQAGKLSGGNKRKLSVAICILGNPPVILLDEPSTGIDPSARRQMWAFLSNISKHSNKSLLIISTHSMEEAEALSNKIGINSLFFLFMIIAILVNGTFRCCGTSQYIKGKFGSGYEIEIKTKSPSDEQIKRELEKNNFEESKYSGK